MFENLTVEQLKGERADIFDSIFKLGLDEGIKKGGEYGQKQERERVVSILKKAGAFRDMNDLALVAVENGLSLDQSTISFQEKQLTGLQDAQAPGVGPDGDESKGRKPTTHLERARAYRQEHNCSMTEALKATAEKRKQ